MYQLIIIARLHLSDFRYNRAFFHRGRPVDFALLKTVILPKIPDIEPPFQENFKIFTGP